VTTGRPRDCGWLDLVHLAHCCHFGSITEITLTKLDVLSGLESVPVCYGYEFEGKPVTATETLTSRVLREAKPIYLLLDGWSEDISSCRKLDELPKAARDYVSFVEYTLDVPVRSIGVGPDREQIIRVTG
jgi:adenylosuccinate synthase